jgi:hypothetical protein
MIPYNPCLRVQDRILWRLCITPSETITLHKALGNCCCPYALSSAECPYIISMVTDPFAAKFKCTSNEALGQPLAHFVSSWCENLNWDVVLNTVVNGQRVSGMLSSGLSTDNFCPISEQMTFVPVVETPNGRVRHILVLFSQVPSPVVQPLAGLCTMHSTNVRQPNFLPSSPSSADLNSSPIPRVAVISSRSSCIHPSPTPHSDQAIILRPRSSHRAPAKRASEVAVTPELLGTLRSLPLPRAAAAAGVSATAFKKACRRLGVRRWGYTRGPAKRGLREGSAAAVTSAARRHSCLPPAPAHHFDPAAPPSTLRSSCVTLDWPAAPAARPAAGWPLAAGLWPGPLVGSAGDGCVGQAMPAGGFQDGAGGAAAGGAVGWPGWAADGKEALWEEEEEEGGAAADDELVLDMLAQPWPEPPP